MSGGATIGDNVRDDLGFASGGNTYDVDRTALCGNWAVLVWPPINFAVASGVFKLHLPSQLLL